MQNITKEVKALADAGNFKIVFNGNGISFIPKEGTLLDTVNLVAMARVSMVCIDMDNADEIADILDEEGVNYYEYC